MPVSKKRKKKREKKSGPSLPKSRGAPKKKITKQKILLYIISGVMIISLAASFLVSGSGSSSSTPYTPAPQPQTSDGDNPLTNPPTSVITDSQSVEVTEESSVEPETVSEPGVEY